MDYYIYNGAIYDGTDVQISALTILNTPTTGTNIIREDLDYFSTYFTYTYYISILKNKFLKNICSCGNTGLPTMPYVVNSYSPNYVNGVVDRGYNTNNIKQDRTTVDVLMMGLEIIKYLLEYLLYMEAERIIEQIQPCNTGTNLGCGCNG